MNTLTEHPMSAIFPEMSEGDFSNLVADIRTHGVREPVWLYEGKILDGRNRYRACQEAGKKCPTRDYMGSRQDALALVWSMNRERRHLNASQAAAAEVKRAQLIAEYAAEVEKLKAEADKKKREQIKQQPRGEKGRVAPLRERIPQAASADDRRTLTQRAKAAGTNRKYLEAAEKLAVTHPEKVDEVLRGEKTIPQAVREVKAEQQGTSAVPPSSPAKPANNDPALFEPDGTPRVPGMTFVEEWKLVTVAIEHLKQARKALEKCQREFGFGEKSRIALRTAQEDFRQLMKGVLS